MSLTKRLILARPSPPDSDRDENPLHMRGVSLVVGALFDRLINDRLVPFNNVFIDVFCLSN